MSTTTQFVNQGNITDLMEKVRNGDIYRVCKYPGLYLEPVYYEITHRNRETFSLSLGDKVMWIPNLRAGTNPMTTATEEEEERDYLSSSDI